MTCTKLQIHWHQNIISIQFLYCNRIDTFGAFYFQRRVHEMDRVKLEELVLGVLGRLPDLVYDLLQSEDSYPGPPERDDDAPGWCVCHNCQEMATDRENLCCGLHPENCISTQPVNIL